jgi:uncharacterized membrane protein YgaE (UPF0421/DUF939 family)
MKRLRFVLAVGSLLGIFVSLVLILFFGHEVTTVQVALIAPLATALVAEAKSASSFIFDGIPEKMPVEPVSDPVTIEAKS